VSKNTYINVRVDEETKKEVKDTLDILGINMSTAVDLFLNQIILNKGLPFKVKLPSKDITVKEQKLAEALNLTGGKPYPKKFKKLSTFMHVEKLIMMLRYMLSRKPMRKID
jgi:DNA-damage-inducible protein J